jgi:hypothetical protein
VENRSEEWEVSKFFFSNYPTVETYLSTQFNLGIYVTHVLFHFLVHTHEMTSQTASHIFRRIYVTSQLCTIRGTDVS